MSRKYVDLPLVTLNSCDVPLQQNTRLSCICDQRLYYLSSIWPILVFVVPEPGPSTLGSMLMPAQETEWEELIRTGHMTPFGTRIPQTEEKKEPRKPMLAENSAFDQYLTDQAKLATERKRTPHAKKRRSSATHQQGSKGIASSPKDKKMHKRLRKLQITALKAHPNARPKSEPQAPKPKRKTPIEGDEGDSDGSEYLPSDEGFDPEREERDAMEEGFGEDVDDDEYELKAYKRKNEAKGKRPVKKQQSDDQYSDEEDDGKSKEKKFKDDGDVEYYRQRIR